ncbi:MAG TPA: alpha-amylase [Gemmobacter sp.]|nr:alpha-amylase [Gemmobacter sp.]
MARRPASWDDEVFALRLARSGPDLWPMLQALYGHRADYAKFCDRLKTLLRKSWKARPADLKRLDLKRDLEPDWFQRPDRAGYVFYIDRFAGTLQDIPEKLDYIEDLGATYLHLMPCLMPRPGDSDGGYSIMDYRAVNPAFGTMEDLEEVATALRERGMNLCIDLVLNHTAKEHAWAQAARAGDPKYQDYYLMFDTDELPKRFEETLVEIFPEHAPGSFTHDPETGKWVWTTFYDHQWDLNWANPEVFLEITDVMLNLANKGVDVLRLDAVAFMWKRLGTRCQSEPEVHMLLQALRACSRIAAPAVIHLEEAIVAPAEMLPYLGRGRHDGKEGNLAYHNSLMVQFWNALATRDTRMMAHVLATHFPPVLTNATYATYLRCHDDIGWAITDEDAGALHISGAAHRSYLSDFYEGSFPGSFARGAVFQYNPETNDKRITGSFASLAGLEAATDPAATEAALHRILMGHALMASFGGIPLVYMGDELALLNDYGYRDDPAHAHDSRWLNRPRMDWAQAATRHSADTPAARCFRGVKHILARRAATPELHGGVPTEILHPAVAGLFAFARRAPAGTLVCLFNFTDSWSHLDAGWLQAQGVRLFHDALADIAVPIYDGNVALAPQGRLWLR